MSKGNYYNIKDYHKKGVYKVEHRIGRIINKSNKEKYSIIYIIKFH